MRSIEDCYLYGILDTGYLGDRNPGEVARQMIEGGVDIIQIRAKDCDQTHCAELASLTLKVTRPLGIPLIINDHPEIALEVDADGVHVGQDDVSVKEVREQIGPGKIVGKSTHSLEQAVQAAREGPDYIGVGPVFATLTKPTYIPVGLPLIEAVGSRVRLPFFCIGGINLENAAGVIKTGAKRIVVVSGILKARDIAGYCRGLKGLLGLANDP